MQDNNIKKRIVYIRDYELDDFINYINHKNYWTFSYDYIRLSCHDYVLCEVKLCDVDFYGLLLQLYMVSLNDCSEDEIRSIYVLERLKKDLDRIIQCTIIV